MQRHALVLVLANLVALAATGARADVTVSSDATQNMSCAIGVCAPTASDAVLNVGDLENLLASGNVTVTTTGAGGVQATNILINAALTWSTGNELTLDAYRSIKIHQSIIILGLSGLTLRMRDGGSIGRLYVARDAGITFSNISSQFTVNGAAYALVNTLQGLADAVAENPSGDYALAQSYDASQDGIYKSSPIATTFGGIFEGLGNTISGLTVRNRASSANVGLFSRVYRHATITNLRLRRVRVSSNGEFSAVGTLVGQNSGMISRADVKGSVASSNYESIGGLVGQNTGGKIADSRTKVDVRGAEGQAGGIVSWNVSNGNVHNCIAEGNVAGGDYVGGLVGYNVVGTISNSWAIGSASGTGDVGGLAGINIGTITKSFATGAATSSGGYVGGLVGHNGADQDVGNIVDSYSTGSATGTELNDYTGGLVGWNSEFSTVTSSYSTGAPTGQSGDVIGGLIGNDSSPPGNVSVSYWDVTTSGITNLSQGAGNISNDPGITGLTTEQLQSGLPAGFDPAIWAENANINGGLPYLIVNPPK